MNWYKSMKEEVKVSFNAELSTILTNCVDLGYKEFNSYMKVTAKKVAYKAIEDNKG